MPHQRFEPGTQWLLKLNDALWPCIVFRADKLLSPFREIRKSIDEVPVFLMVKETFVWSAPQHLVEYPKPYISNTSAKDEDLRKRAFDEAANWQPLWYFEDIVMAKTERQASKMRNPVGMQNPLGQAKPDFVSLKRTLASDTVMLPNKKVRPIFDSLSASRAEAEARRVLELRGFDDSDDEFQFERHFNDETNHAEDVNPGPPLTPEEQEASKQKVIIYLGEGLDEATFETNMYVVDQHNYFKSHLILETKDTAVGDPQVRSQDLIAMTKEDFAPIGEFLTTKDYTPNLSSGPPPYLLGVKSIKQHEEAALQAGGIWNHAKTFELTSLMHLIYRKIQAQWPLDNDPLLMFTQLVYFDNDAGFNIETRMKDLLKGEIAKRFFELMHQDALLLSRLMRWNEDICEHIGRHLAKDPKNAGKMNLVEG